MWVESLQLVVRNHHFVVLLIQIRRTLKFSEQSGLGRPLSRHWSGLQILGHHHTWTYSDEISYGGFLKWGYPNSWMVCKEKNQWKWMMIWGYPYFRKPPYVLWSLIYNIWAFPLSWRYPLITLDGLCGKSHRSKWMMILGGTPSCGNPHILTFVGWFSLVINHLCSHFGRVSVRLKVG